MNKHHLHGEVRKWFIDREQRQRVNCSAKTPISLWGYVVRLAAANKLYCLFHKPKNKQTNKHVHIALIYLFINVFRPGDCSIALKLPSFQRFNMLTETLSARVCRFILVQAADKSVFLEMKTYVLKILHWCTVYVFFPPTLLVHKERSPYKWYVVVLEMVLLD